MLLQNQTLHAQYPYTRRGASTVATEAGNLRSQLGIRGSSQLTRFVSGWYKWQSLPQGYSIDSSLLAPLKGGGLGASYGAIEGDGELTSALSLGKNCEASLSGSGTVSTASLSMLVQLACSILGEGLVDNAEMKATINMAATLAGEGDINGALGVIAFCTATLTGSGTVAPSSAFTGLCSMSATISTAQEGQLTPAQVAAAVWDALAADYDTSGTMGEKLNAAGTAGDPWTTDLSSYTIAGTAGDTLKKALPTGTFIALN